MTIPTSIIESKTDDSNAGTKSSISERLAALYSAFSFWQRATIIAIVSTAGLLSPLSSVLYTPALPKIADDLGVSISAVNLTITTYLIFQGISPTVWGAIGDSLGRRMLYITTLSIYIGACIGLSITNSYSAVLVLRALQATGSASTIALGAGVIGDIIPASQRGGYMGLYSAGVGLGTAVGPVLGGIFAQYTGWHGIFIFLLALSVAMLAFIIFVFPETLRSIVGNGSTPPPPRLRPPFTFLCPPMTSEDHDPLPPKRMVDILGPLRLLKQPDVLCCLSFTGICYAVWQMSMVATSTLYASEYRLSEVKIGLTYLSNGLGALVGSLLTGKMLDRDYKEQLRRETIGIVSPKHQVVMIERARIISLRVPVPLFIACIIAFGWVIQSHAHIAVSIVLAFFIGWFDTSILSTFSTLMVDLFEDRSSTATASINLVRCLLGAAGTSAIEPMITAVGPGWTFTILGGICVLALPVVWVEFQHGSSWRARRTALPNVDVKELPPYVESPLRSPSKQYSKDYSSPASFPIDYSRPKVLSGDYGTVDSTVANKSLVTGLSGSYLGRLDSALLSAFCATIYRITGQDDGVLGFSCGEEDCARPMHFRFDPTILALNLNGQTHDLIRCTDHHKTLQPNKTPVIGTIPYRVLFSLPQQLGERSQGVSPLDCEWQIACRTDTIRVRVHYSQNLFSQESIQMFVDVFARVLSAFASNPSTSISRLPLCTSGDIEEIREWNNVHKKPLDVSSVSALFQRIAREAGDDLAVVNSDQSLSLTFRQLDSWSDALAQFLLSKGCGGDTETIIGVWQGRGALLIVSYLACLKAGCAYMPVEMTLPGERIRMMLNDTCSPIVLGNGLAADFPCKDMVEYIDLCAPDMQAILRAGRIPTGPYFPSLTPDRLSSVIFTSGSTGVPKAIMIQHSCLLNFIHSLHKPIGRGDRTAVMLNIAFDVSSGEIWYPLIQGSTLVCYIQPPASPFDVDNLASFLAREQITYFSAPTAIFKALVDSEFFKKSLPMLRCVDMAGEAAFLEFVQPAISARPDLVICNHYGPSESTIFATAFEIPSDYCRASVAIGRPLANIGAYVVDEGLQLVPRGVCGELLLTGRSLARGYLNRPELTATKFITLGDEHPLGPLRAYHTGDIVRRTAENELEFICRKEDGQVKLRGQRLELGEVEKAIKQYPDVHSSLVVLCKRSGGDCLVGYFTTRSGTCGAGITDAIQTQIRAFLPGYMVPPILLHVPAFELTPTGKIDRKLMANPAFVDKTVANTQSRSDVQTNGRQPPRNPQEAIVLDIFAEALSVPAETIDVHDNLFDIGGHSLIATRIVSAIRRRFAIVLDMPLFMNSATIEDIALIIGQRKSDESLPLMSITRLRDEEYSSGGLFPTSDAQVRLWIDEKLNPGLSRYNVPYQRKVTGPLDAQALGNAFVALIERHEILRTTYEMQGSMLMQRIEPSDYAAVRVMDIRGHTGNRETHARTILATEHSTPFDLSKEIPVRIAIIRASTNVHFVSVIFHHIATDGWSESIIDRELAILYNALSSNSLPQLSQLPLRYRDYSVWQRQRAEAGILQSQLDYWGAQLDGAIPLEIPTDFERPEKLSGKADEVSFDIEASCLSSLRHLAALHRTSLYVVLLAAFRATVYRTTGEEDGSIAMANANRPLAELEGIVGFFVNTHAIRLLVDSSTSFGDLIVQTKRVTAEALQNSELPFDKVVAKLAPQRQLSRNPLVQLMFVLQDFAGVVNGGSGHGLRDVTLEEIRDSTTTRLDLSIHLFLRNKALRGYAMYQSDLFRPDTIKTFVTIFQRILVTASLEPSLSLSKLALSTQSDLHKIAIWNDTWKPCRSDVSIGDRFREIAAREGSSPAVCDGSTSLSYAELDEQTDRLAAWLVGKGLQQEEVVGIWMGRSVLLVVVYLGCLKAGLAYMPLDRAHPADRLRLMTQSANCRLILVAGDYPLAHEIECVDLARDKSIILTTPRIDLPAVPSHCLSNIMFTSGSTGTPKGVMVEHRGMVNLCAPETTNWPGKLRSGLTTGIGFDPSGFQIFSTLLGGSQLYCFPDSGIFDADEYRRFMVDHRVQRCFLTPSILSALLENLDDWLERSSLVHLLLGGEKLEPAKIAECRRRLPSLQISSSYGPSEASVRSAYFSIPSYFDQQNLRRIPIGRALPNTRIYIVDDTLSPVPAGVLGEIVVSGTHVTRGYLNQPQLTAERFIQLPDQHPLGFHRLYRTGDLGSWTEDGLVQYVGRADTQLKLRGQRIEAGEIEEIMQHHPAVKSSAVALVKAEKGEQLVAYTIFDSDAQAGDENKVLALWKDHYNEESPYDSLDAEAAGHDFARWFSMFTGERIPTDQMQQWLDDTIDQLAPTAEDRVLEVGVGTGMVALNVADRVKSYVGTDLSAPSLDFLEAQIQLRGLSSKISLVKAAAHEIDALPNTGFSLVILNSVLQYFPSAQYLTQVVGKMLAVMEGGGRIYIGDVRSYSLIPYHNVERALAALEIGATLDDIQVTLERYVEGQTELLIDPAFFFGLQRRMPAIVHVEIKPKLMAARNELSRYRYTVILHVNARPQLNTPITWVDCSSPNWTISGLRSTLHVTRESVIGALNIPVADIRGVRHMLDHINRGDPNENVLTLRQSLSAHRSSDFSIAASIHQMAEEDGWCVTLDYTLQGGSENSFRAIFKRKTNDSNPKRSFVGNFPVPPFHGPSHNILTTGATDFAVTLNSVEEYLRERLPAYMVPSRIISVAELPLNRSGKLDRKLLASSEYLAAHDSANHSQEIEGPSTDAEREVLEIFSHALNRPPESIDTRESLFRLGGHSLMATLVVNAVQRDLGVELSMASFFRQPTIKGVAAFVTSQREKGAPNHPRPLHGGGAGVANATIVANADRSGPTLFIFSETTGFASVYSSAFENIMCKVVAFGDEHWGQPLDGDSIQSIAAAFVNKVRDIQPEGPYYLSGWSFGGYVALEAACQLEAAGISVAVVMMFDSNIYDRPSQAMEWSRDLEHLLAVVNDKAAWLAQFNRVNTLISNYKVRRGGYTGKAVLVKALRIDWGDEQDPPPENPRNDWLEYLPQLDVRGFDASHRLMFDHENGPRMGTLISQIMKETTALE